MVQNMGPGRWEPVYSGDVGGEDRNSRALWTASFLRSPHGEGRLGGGERARAGHSHNTCSVACAFPSGPTPRSPKQYGAGFRQMLSGMGLLTLLLSCELGSNELSALQWTRKARMDTWTLGGNEWLHFLGCRWAMVAVSLPPFPPTPWAYLHLTSPCPTILTSANRLCTGSLNSGAPLKDRPRGDSLGNFLQGTQGCEKRARAWRQVEWGWESLTPPRLLIWKPGKRLPKGRLWGLHQCTHRAGHRLRHIESTPDLIYKYWYLLNLIGELKKKKE